MNTQSRGEAETTPLDEAARAAWHYYVGGKTQDQIARDMGISRQRAQRLVSRAVAEGLIHFRLEHRLAATLELEAELSRRFGLELCRVAPSLGPGADPVISVAPIAAAEMERLLSQSAPLVMALGTGRFLRASIEEMRAMECPQHRIVSLNGNIAPDASASFFDVIMRIADKVRAPHYPMPLPVLASSVEERDVFHRLAPVKRARALAQSASITVVGIGQMDDTAPLVKDGFMSPGELSEACAAGAVGEIAGWAYDAGGQYLDNDPNSRVAGVRVEPPSGNLVIAVAAGDAKIPGLRGAISGRLINGLITDEATAETLLG